MSASPQSPFQEQDALHVYFEGDWSAEERALVEAAAEEAEEALRASTSLPQIQAPWVAVCHSEEGGRLYVASRHGSARVLRARSVEALAMKIRAFRPVGQAAT